MNILNLEYVDSVSTAETILGGDQVPPELLAIIRGRQNSLRQGVASSTSDLSSISGSFLTNFDNRSVDPRESNTLVFTSVIRPISVSISLNAEDFTQ
jgi:hypothetical protein